MGIFAADVRDFDAVQRAVVEGGPIDVLVVNQWAFVPEEMEKQDEIRFMIDVNLMGSFNMIKAALPEMKNKKDGGPASIAVMSSQAGQVSRHYLFPILFFTMYLKKKIVKLTMSIFRCCCFLDLSRWVFMVTRLTLRVSLVIRDNIHVSIIFPPDTETPGLIESMTMKSVSGAF